MAYWISFYQKVNFSLGLCREGTNQCFITAVRGQKHFLPNLLEPPPWPRLAAWGNGYSLCHLHLLFLPVGYLIR